MHACVSVHHSLTMVPYVDFGRIAVVHVAITSARFDFIWRARLISANTLINALLFHVPTVRNTIQIM